MQSIAAPLMIWPKLMACNYMRSAVVGPVLECSHPTGLLPTPPKSSPVACKITPYVLSQHDALSALPGHINACGVLSHAIIHRKTYPAAHPNSFTSYLNDGLHVLLSWLHFCPKPPPSGVLWRSTTRNVCTLKTFTLLSFMNT